MESKSDDAATERIIWMLNKYHELTNGTIVTQNDHAKLVDTLLKQYDIVVKLKKSNLKFDSQTCESLGKRNENTDTPKSDSSLKKFGGTNEVKTNYTFNAPTQRSKAEASVKDLMTENEFKDIANVSARQNRTEPSSVDKTNKMTIFDRASIPLHSQASKNNATKLTDENQSKGYATLYAEVVEAITHNDDDNYYKDNYALSDLEIKLMVSDKMLIHDSEIPKVVGKSEMRKIKLNTMSSTDFQRIPNKADVANANNDPNDEESKIMNNTIRHLKGITYVDNKGLHEPEAISFLEKQLKDDFELMANPVIYTRKGHCSKPDAVGFDKKTLEIFPVEIKYCKLRIVQEEYNLRKYDDKAFDNLKRDAVKQLYHAMYTLNSQFGYLVIGADVLPKFGAVDQIRRVFFYQQLFRPSKAFTDETIEKKIKIFENTVFKKIHEIAKVGIRDCRGKPLGPDDLAGIFDFGIPFQKGLLKELFNYPSVTAMSVVLEKLNQIGAGIKKIETRYNFDHRGDNYTALKDQFKARVKDLNVAFKKALKDGPKDVSSIDESKAGTPGKTDTRRAASKNSAIKEKTPSKTTQKNHK